MNTMPAQGVHALKACTGRGAPPQSDSDASAAESESAELQPLKSKKSEKASRARTISSSSAKSNGSDMSSPGADKNHIEMTDARERTLSNTSIGSGDGDMIRPAGFSYGRRRTLSQTGAYGRVVILAVDPSDNAKMAMEWYLAQLHKSTDYLVLVHIPEAPRLPTFSFKSGMAPPVDEWKKILDEMNEKTRKLEEDYEGTCIAKKLRYKVRGEAMKNPGEGIIKIAEEERAEMIVMGTRGIGGMKRALSGSVSDFVMRNATCPVITVPGQKIAKRRQSEAAIHE